MTPQIKIEKDIPAPRGGSTRKYPFYEMEKGDSFFVAGADRSNVGGSSAYAATKIGGGCKFKISVREESGVKGVRVWRIA